MAATTRVSLSPSPGFCVKSTALSAPLSEPDSPPTSHSLINIPVGLKIFVNIAWDSNVPPPPDASDAAIDRAVTHSSTNLSEHDTRWFIPLIVSDPRTDSDKAGKPSVVFDCVFNSTLKSRALRSNEFKTFLIELAFQRIEAQHSLLLSRQIGTPNIASKGKLQPRSVLVPTSLFSSAPSTTTHAGAPLIEELPPSLPSPPAARSQPSKGILKSGPKTSQVATQPKSSTTPTASLPQLSWSPTDDGHLRIALSVPHLTRASIPNATLDLEPRRLIFIVPVPTPYALDLDLSQPDDVIQKLFGGTEIGDSAMSAMSLKRESPLDVDGARAEWHVAQRQLIIYA
ncbi:hypothetical protein GSI_11681 [Ganoderma sinense ZZ0214-1]|uniref:PIH1 N-terminal domain-containing protein n=1 Tax=Ganoderma sinense ZZ0214-1 TaxID=1077348 RepID=A0A2G8RX81_9APHY|nr:hypothetical protein GSI_11681 [Ganoderma sinense ZZ0214-1]